MRSPEQRAGFTLLELMVVIVLIGIMTAMILPDMRGTYADVLLRAASRKIVSLCQLANSRAITLNKTHRLRFERTSGRYFLERQTDNSASDFRPLTELSGMEGVLERRLVVEIQKAIEDPASANPWIAPSAPDTIAFYPDGTAEQAEILLRERSGLRLALRINPVTARVQIIESEQP